LSPPLLFLGDIKLCSISGTITKTVANTMKIIIGEKSWYINYLKI